MNRGAQLIRNWQRTLNLGQDAAAKKLGISQANLSRILRGTVPSVATVRQIAPVLNVSPLKLLLEFGIIELADDPLLWTFQRGQALKAQSWLTALATYNAILEVMIEEQSREGTEPAE